MRILSIAMVMLAVASGLGFAQKKTEPPDVQIQNAHWIWLKGFEEKADATVFFRKTLTLTGKWRAAALQIACDNEYKLWINGVEIGATAAGSAGAWTRSDGYDIADKLKEGQNLIAIQGTNQADKAALIAAIAIEQGRGKTFRVVTDGSWQAASRTDDDWQRSAASQGDWQPALDLGVAETADPWFVPRPPSDLAETIARLRTELVTKVVPLVSAKLDAASTATVSDFVGSSDGGKPKVGAMVIKTTAPGQKAVLTCDFGRELVGYPSIVGQAYGDARITVACGEYESECLDPYQAPSTRAAKTGGLHWSPEKRMAFRYARFTIEPTQVMRIDRIEAQVIGSPVEFAGSFKCSDDLLNTIYDVSAHTLELCMQDFYEDGIKRDCKLWTGDLRVEALANYYVFGDAGLARQSLMLLADLQQVDGMIPGLGPDPGRLCLPDYCAYWVLTFADYYQHTGDTIALKALYPHLRKLMEWFKANSDRSGMFVRANRPGWWIFVDWDKSLEKNDRVMAMEALYYWALTDAADLAKAMGSNRDANEYLDRASKLSEAVNSALWSKENGAYVDCLSEQGLSKSVHRQPNSLAILAGLPDPGMTAAIVSSITRSSVTPAVTTPYMNFYVASALYEAGRPTQALGLVRSYWGGMVARGATTFWERFDPQWPVPYEDKEMSYCHGWSAGPGQLLPAYVAGVRPLTPGFAQVLISPELCNLAWAKATVPTPLDAIKVDWKSERGCAVGEITLPKGCTARVSLPSPPRGAVYAVDGKPADVTQGNGKAAFTLEGGKTYVVGIVNTP